ncbi:hypothetical protein DICVIV_09995 [Dictyocaulus viviparus]|uniref:Uncharacterized protein n=1 Tax=Dictyocaulus viviparus TaxID=29172 RepID=A0A0D8XJP5_DICVI|nr:hypothetical protein DICVIV_09995 [Dictyocaulus viviparus]
MEERQPTDDFYYSIWSQQDTRDIWHHFKTSKKILLIIQLQQSLIARLRKIVSLACSTKSYQQIRWRCYLTSYQQKPQLHLKMRGALSVIYALKYFVALQIWCIRMIVQMFPFNK